MSDMIEGTGYDAFDHPWNTGHGSKYWKDYGKQETEFFLPSILHQGQRTQLRWR
ncbi:hypothetical protein O209_13395 [Lactiplantibacillus plantarum WHE 92]|nr:hypothetical protein O209_13395 [Lactiplantibacillus plantarum WHE 92]